MEKWVSDDNSLEGSLVFDGEFCWRFMVALLMDNTVGNIEDYLIV
jgi:hypothetical protein